VKIIDYLYDGMASKFFEYFLAVFNIAGPYLLLGVLAGIFLSILLKKLKILLLLVFVFGFLIKLWFF